MGMMEREDLWRKHGQLMSQRDALVQKYPYLMWDNNMYAPPEHYRRHAYPQLYPQYHYPDIYGNTMYPYHKNYDRNYYKLLKRPAHSGLKTEAEDEYEMKNPPYTLQYKKPYIYLGDKPPNV